MGEDLLRYSEKNESSDLRQCPYDHSLTNKAYLSGIKYQVLLSKKVKVKHIYESFTHKMAAKPACIDLERNYVTVTLCIVASNWVDLFR